MVPMLVIPATQEEAEAGESKVEVILSQAKIKRAGVYRFVAECLLSIYKVLDSVSNMPPGTPQNLGWDGRDGKGCLE